MSSLFQLLHSCFGRGGGTVKLNDNDTIPGCRFCNVSQSGFDVVWETPTLVVFRDRNPAAAEHLLVIPVKHICGSVKELRSEDVPLLQDMREAGHHALDNLNIPPGSRRLGFHIPPFNSVMHLHLHALGLPFLSLYRQSKYPISEGSSGKTKGFSWFVEIDQAISILGHGGKISIFPC